MTQITIEDRIAYATERCRSQKRAAMERLASYKDWGRAASAELERALARPDDLAGIEAAAQTLASRMTDLACAARAALEVNRLAGEVNWVLATDNGDGEDAQ